ncbi:MAG TPA: VOC family protein [Alphaproteobacteria bacterium]|nr:VOC family protein [Alphaproteobacteria bacterium]
MVAKLAKQAIDVGLVTFEGAQALAFYRDLLGFVPDGEVPFPGLGTVSRFRCGESIFRILVLEKPPAAEASKAGFAAQSGLRYLTLSVSNLDELVGEARAKGYAVPVAPRELRPGVRVAQIEDGLGTWIELMQSEG